MKDIRKIKKILRGMCSADIRIVIDECLREMMQQVRLEYIINVTREPRVMRFFKKDIRGNYKVKVKKGSLPLVDD